MPGTNSARPQRPLRYDGRLRTRPVRTALLYWSTYEVAKSQRMADMEGDECQNLQVLFRWWIWCTLNIWMVNFYMYIQICFSHLNGAGECVYPNVHWTFEWWNSISKFNMEGDVCQNLWMVNLMYTEYLILTFGWWMLMYTEHLDGEISVCLSTRYCASLVPRLQLLQPASLAACARMPHQRYARVRIKFGYTHSPFKCEK